MGRKITGLLLAAMLTVAACGSDEARVPPPDDLESPLLRVQWEGGFVPVEHALGAGPSFQLSGDGTLIFAGVTTLQYPGPLVIPYQQVSLSQEDVDRVIALIEEIGLPEMTDERDDSQMNNVADAATYVVSYFDNESIEHKYSVYALGLESEGSSAATQKTLELDRLLLELSGGAPPQDYEADRIKVIAGQAMAEPEPGFEDIRAWPLPDSPEGWSGFSGIDWKCNVYPGDAIDLFTDATQATQWTAPEDGDGNYTLVVRQLLPGEAGCPDIESEL
jgi:hypothetical protein